MGLIWAIIVLYALKAHYALKVPNSAILPLKWPKWAIISAILTYIADFWGIIVLIFAFGFEKMVFGNFICFGCI